MTLSLLGYGLAADCRPSRLLCLPPSPPPIPAAHPPPFPPLISRHSNSHALTMSCRALGTARKTLPCSAIGSSRLPPIPPPAPARPSLRAAQCAGLLRSNGWPRTLLFGIISADIGLHGVFPPAASALPHARPFHRQNRKDGVDSPRSDSVECGVTPDYARMAIPQSFRWCLGETSA